MNGTWRKIESVRLGREEDRFIVLLSCGHKVAIHKDMPSSLDNYNAADNMARCFKCRKEEAAAC